MQKEEQDKDKRRLIVIFIFLCMIIIAMGSVVAVIHFSRSQVGSGEKSDADTAVVKNNDKTVSMEYSGHITVDTASGNIKLYFKNPTRSQKSVKLEAVGNIDGEEIVLFETEKLAPGEKIEEMTYNGEKEFVAGSYDGKLVVHFYDANGREEIVNSEILVDVVIK